MDWTNAIQNAVDYIEKNITADITVEDVAEHVFFSPFYFQKGFSMLCGFSVSEYIRNRRLALAGVDLASADEKIIDIALKYGYDSPDSFTRAFTRFHGASPSAVRKGEVMIRTFAPLKLEISLKGGYIMNYKIEKKESFTVLGVSRTFDYETCKKEIPEFWSEHYASGGGKNVLGMLGVNIDCEMGHSSFEYLIADFYEDNREIPEGCVVKIIPEFTWAVFSCDGPMPEALQDVNQKIFSEWLPAIREYEFAAGFCIEMYDDPSRYPKGNRDENYHSEIWIPVKKKQA